MFTPMPHTANAPSSDMASSVSTPASLRPPTTMSLGHLRRTPGQPASRKAPMAPIAQATGKAGNAVADTSGLRRTERYRPPAGDAHIWVR